MNRLFQLIKSAGTLLFAKAAAQVVNFLLLPVYTAVLSTAEYGEIDLYTTSAMIVLPILTLQIEQALFRYLLDADTTEKKKEVLTSGVLVTLGTFSLSSLVYFALSTLLSFRDAGFVALFYLTQGVSAVLLQVARGYGDNVGYGIGTFMLTAVSLLCNIVLVAFLGMGVAGALISTAAANIVTSCFLAWRTKINRYLDLAAFSRNRARKLLNYSLPLIVNQISSWAVNYSNRLILIAFFGIGASGVFAAASKFSNILSTVFNNFNLAWTENMVISSRDDDHVCYASQMMTATTYGYAMMVVAALVVLPACFPLLVDPSFSDAYQQVPFLLIGMLFSGLAAVLGSIFIVHEMTKSVAITTFVSGLTCVALNVILASPTGLYSASISFAIAFAAMCVYRYKKMRTFTPISINFKKLLPVVVYLTISFVLYTARVPLGSACFGLLVAAIEVCRQRKKIIRLLKKGE